MYIDYNLTASKMSSVPIIHIKVMAIPSLAADRVEKFQYDGIVYKLGHINPLNFCAIQEGYTSRLSTISCHGIMS